MREGRVATAGGNAAAGARLRALGWDPVTVTLGGSPVTAYAKGPALIAMDPGGEFASTPVLWTPFGPRGPAPEPQMSEGMDALCDSSPGGSMDFSTQGG